MKKLKNTEVVTFRISKEIMDIIRERAKAENRTQAKQIESMILQNKKLLEAKQPFILALFPQGAKEEEIDKILESVSSLQIGTAP